MNVVRFVGTPDVRIFFMDDGTMQVVLADNDGNGAILPFPDRNGVVEILRKLAEVVEKTPPPPEPKASAGDPRNN